MSAQLAGASKANRGKVPPWAFLHLGLTERVLIL